MGTLSLWSSLSQSCSLMYLMFIIIQSFSVRVRFLQLLTARQPLNRYVGEIISEAEAEMRQNDAYLFSLDDKVMHILETHCTKKLLKWMNECKYRCANSYHLLVNSPLILFYQPDSFVYLSPRHKIYTASMPVSMETSAASSITCVSPTCSPVECSRRTRTFVSHTSPSLLVKTSWLERSLGILFPN